MIGQNAFLGFEERILNSTCKPDWSDDDDWSDDNDWGESVSDTSWGENATGSEDDGGGWTNVGIWGNQD